MYSLFSSFFFCALLLCIKTHNTALYLGQCNMCICIGFSLIGLYPSTFFCSALNCNKCTTVFRPRSTYRTMCICSEFSLIGLYQRAHFLCLSFFARHCCTIYYVGRWQNNWLVQSFCAIFYTIFCFFHCICTPCIALCQCKERSPVTGQAGGQNNCLVQSFAQVSVHRALHII